MFDLHCDRSDAETTGLIKLLRSAKQYIYNMFKKNQLNTIIESTKIYNRANIKIDKTLATDRKTKGEIDLDARLSTFSQIGRGLSTTLNYNLRNNETMF